MTEGGCSSLQVLTARQPFGRQPQARLRLPLRRQKWQLTARAAMPWPRASPARLAGLGPALHIAPAWPPRAPGGTGLQLTSFSPQVDASGQGHPRSRIPVFLGAPTSRSEKAFSAEVPGCVLHGQHQGRETKTHPCSSPGAPPSPLRLPTPPSAPTPRELPCTPPHLANIGI